MAVWANTARVEEAGAHARVAQGWWMGLGPVLRGKTSLCHRCVKEGP